MWRDFWDLLAGATALKEGSILRCERSRRSAVMTACSIGMLPPALARIPSWKPCRACSRAAQSTVAEERRRFTKKSRPVRLHPSFSRAAPPHPLVPSTSTTNRNGVCHAVNPTIRRMRAMRAPGSDAQWRTSKISLLCRHEGRPANANPSVSTAPTTFKHTKRRC